MMERATRKRKRVDDLEKVNPNTAKKRRQRANIKKDEARLMEARRKDRERKRLSTLARKKHLDSHSHLKKAEQEKKLRIEDKTKRNQFSITRVWQAGICKKAESKEERLAEETENSEARRKEKKKGGKTSAELADESQASEVPRK